MARGGEIGARGPRPAPLLDILQSIPVLIFLPGVMLGMVALFPPGSLGWKLGSVLLIFTGQAWNMHSVFTLRLRRSRAKLDEAAACTASARGRFCGAELPYGRDWTGLEFDDVGSGGWFFLMACECSFWATAIFACGPWFLPAGRRRRGTCAEYWWGMAVMIAVIVLLDQLCGGR